MPAVLRDSDTHTYFALGKKKTAPSMSDGAAWK